MYLTTMHLAREAYSIAASYKDKSTGTHIQNIIPHMFTFLAVPGMPPHNNDTEREIRDWTIPHRNARHKISTSEGRQTMSSLISFTRTCHKQDISPARATLELITNRDWDIFEHAKNTPYSLVNPDGSRCSVFHATDPPSIPSTILPCAAA